MRKQFARGSAASNDFAVVYSASVWRGSEFEMESRHERLVGMLLNFFVTASKTGSRCDPLSSLDVWGSIAAHCLPSDPVSIMIGSS